MRGRRVGLQPAADLEAVHARHHHVEQHDVDLAVLAGLDAPRVRLVAVSTSKYSASSRDFEQFDVGRDVVDDEDAGGHCFLLLRNIARIMRRRDRI